MSLTPMMRQYQSIKKNLPPDTILFFRLGDFYEMFFEDARQASSLLDITLTGRDGGEETRVPMCGVPFHAAQGYINRLTREGLKVAICEQVEDPKLARGIVKREVVRIITPATNLEDETGEKGELNYIVSLCYRGRRWGFSFLELSTGSFRVSESEKVEELYEEILRLRPREFIISKKLDRTLIDINSLLAENNAIVSEYEDWIFDWEESKDRILKQFNISSLSSLGISDMIVGVCSAGAILYYLRDNLHKSLNHLKKPLPFNSREYMVLDRQTLKSLEIINTAASDSKAPSLYKILDMTATPMGARLLAVWIKRPLLDIEKIKERLDAVEELVNNQDILLKLKMCLQPIRDLERLVARINCGAPSARDLTALGASLRSVPAIKQAVLPLKSHLIAVNRGNLLELRQVTQKIDSAFVDSPPPGVKDGGMIKQGYNMELDGLRDASRNAKQWIVSLQAKEAEKTGIKSLKIKFNKVFGYYIEVTKANLPMVPDYYMRKQTLVNAERFTIPELKEYEEKILGSEEKARELEYRIFEEVRNFILQFIPEIQKIAEGVATLDVLASLASAAKTNSYCKPEVSHSSTISITAGRHPVVEQMMQWGEFIENDVLLDTTENQILIITGPNMAGKSTFIRQVALIVLMAQMGSFVPAKKAEIGIVDRIFTRIGASDNLARGESTFMVEMNETANIIHNATKLSLLIFDEIGRGTSTFDGVSIAWSVCEYLNKRDGLRPKTLFATHYHELTELGDHRDGIKNYNITVKELEDGILFLRKLVPGGADKSYGIHVGKLAGLPHDIIRRAQEILMCLEEEKISEVSISKILKKRQKENSIYELPLFKNVRHDIQQKSKELSTQHGIPFEEVSSSHPVIDEIKSINPNKMTPLDALTKIIQWKNKIEIEPE